MKPKIRVKGFEDEWVETLIGDLGSSYSGLSGKTKEDFGKGNAKYITFLNVLTNAQINTNILEAVNVFEGEKQNKVRKDDLLFNTSSETPEEVGMCAVMNEDIDNVYLNSFCFGFRLNNTYTSPLFVSYILRSSVGRRLMSILAQGATRYNLSKSSFCKANILLPSKNDEQKAIASYFQGLDGLIEATAKKIESLKRVKAASLQSMFPQEGETTPRLRFKGFSGEWTETTIEEICEKKSSSLSETSLGPNIGEFPVYGASGYIQNIPYYQFGTPFIGIVKDGSGVGRSQLYQACASILGTMQCIIAKDNVAIDFMAYLFEAIDFSSYIIGSTIPHIYFKDYSRRVVNVPSYEEQKTIGSFFANLDSQISLQTQRLEKLKQIKAACLDYMFV